MQRLVPHGAPACPRTVRALQSASPTSERSHDPGRAPPTQPAAPTPRRFPPTHHPSSPSPDDACVRASRGASEGEGAGGSRGEVPLPRPNDPARSRVSPSHAQSPPCSRRRVASASARRSTRRVARGRTHCRWLLRLKLRLEPSPRGRRFSLVVAPHALAPMRRRSRARRQARTRVHTAGRDADRAARSARPDAGARSDARGAARRRRGVGRS